MHDVMRLFLVFHVWRSHTLVVSTADMVQPIAVLSGEQPVIVRLPESVRESVEPTEPVQIGLQVFRGYAVETEHEILQSSVQRVHPVDRMTAGVRLRKVRAKFRQWLHIGGRTVRQYVRSLAYVRFQRIHDTLLGYDAAPAYGQERASRVVHSGRHSYLLIRQAASAQRLGALVRLAGHDEHGGLGMVALEGFTEVRLIQLHARSSLGTQDGCVPSDAFDDPP